MFNSDWLNVLLAFSWAFVVVIFAIPPVVVMAYRKRLFDMPNVRTMHSNPIPRLGGMAIFAGFMSALTIFGKFVNVGDGKDGIQQLFAACILIFFIGLKDDIIPVSAFKKFLVQVMATSIVVLIGDIRIESFYGFLGFTTLDYGVSYTLTFVVIIGVTNAINLIDGIAGLAGSLIFLISCVFGFFFYFEASRYSYYIVCASLGGSVLAFLRFNFHKAKIFMGDTGSLVSGFIIAVLSVCFIRIQPANFGDGSPAIVVAALFIPLCDTLRVFCIRILHGISPFAPDKNHLHHRLIAFGFTKMTTVVVMVMTNLVVILSTVYLAKSYPLNTTLTFVIVFGIVFSLAVNIITPKPEEIIDRHE